VPANIIEPTDILTPEQLAEASTSRGAGWTHHPERFAGI